MIDYTTVETAIQTALTTVPITDVEIALWPDSEDGYNKPFKYSRVWIAYHSSKYSEASMAIDRVVQEEMATFQLFLQARTLRQVNGIYQLKALVLDRLTGLQVPGFTMLMPVSFEMAERDAVAGGIYGYNLVFKTRAVVQNTSIRPDTDPLPYASDLTELNADYGGYPGTPSTTTDFPLPYPPDTA